MHTTQILDKESAAKVTATRERERALARMVMLYIATGLLFMLLPGTFLGVWNLVSISGRQAANSISPAWLQAHGHAQVFGWIGTFILGIGFYSIPRLRSSKPFALREAWICWALWTTGVAARWAVTVYGWHWRVLMPVSAAMELLAFLIFFRAVSSHKPVAAGEARAKLDRWILVVIAGTLGLLATLVANLGGALWSALHSATPAFTPNFDPRYLALMAWGFLVPFVWGFSARWLPVFLGLRKPCERGLMVIVALNSTGVLLALCGLYRAATLLLLAGAIMSNLALRVQMRPIQAAKTNDVYAGYPIFARLAYAWLVLAAVLGSWAAFAVNPDGIWGASRHALTVGFVATMVFVVGQRVLPAFSGMRLLYSPRLMAIGLYTLTVGCTLRVSSEVLAYQGVWQGAWKVLPVSAVTELTAVTIFALNLALTFRSVPVSSRLVQIRREAAMSGVVNL